MEKVIIIKLNSGTLQDKHTPTLVVVSTGLYTLTLTTNTLPVVITAADASCFLVYTRSLVLSLCLITLGIGLSYFLVFDYTGNSFDSFPCV